MAVTFAAVRMSDGKVLNALEKIRVASGTSGDPAASIVVADGSHPIEASLTAMRDHEAVKGTLDQALFFRFSVRLDGGIAVNVQRRPEGGLDDCRLDFAADVDRPMLARVLAACKSHLEAFDRTEATSRLLGPELAEFYQRREQGLLRLEDLAQKISEQNIAHRHRLDEEMVAERQKLREEYAREAETLRSDHALKVVALQDKEQALEERARALDDRSSRHARRQHHKDLKLALGDRAKAFSLSQTTARKRIPIHALFAILTVVPALVFGWSLYELWHGVPWASTPSDWLRLLRLPLSGLGVAGAVIYWIRWNDHWFSQHAEEEFHLKRLDLDIDRASWVVEMMLEWKDEKGAAIPRDLVESLTRNLFAQDRAAPQATRHPGQDLASAILDASSLNVLIPGLGEAKFGRRALRRLRRGKDTGAGEGTAE